MTELHPDGDILEEQWEEVSSRGSSVSRSQRVLNYAKAFGALAAGAAGVAAMVISLMPDAETVARASHKVTAEMVQTLSADLRREHDRRTSADALLAQDIEHMRSELRLVVELLGSARYTEPRRRPTRRRPATTAPVAATAPSTPADLLDTLRTQVGRKGVTKAAGGSWLQAAPPQRQLPTLQQIQRK